MNGYDIVGTSSLLVVAVSSHIERYDGRAVLSMVD